MSVRSTWTTEYGSARHYVQQGDYWPRDQRYGLLAVGGYGIGSGHGSNVYGVTFVIVDLNQESREMDTRTAFGRHGSDRVQKLREIMCEKVDRMNRSDREFDRA